MKKSDSLYLRLIKRFYGIEGVLDEYKQQAVNQIGNNAFIILAMYLLIANFVAVISAAIYPVENVLITYVGVNSLAIFAIFGYILYRINQLHLTTIETTEQSYEQVLKRLRLKALGWTVYFGFMMWLSQMLLSVVLDNISLIAAVKSWAILRSAIISGVFFGIAMYIYNRVQVRKIK